MRAETLLTTPVPRRTARPPTVPPATSSPTTPAPAPGGTGKGDGSPPEPRGAQAGFVTVRPLLVANKPVGPVEVLSWTCEPVRDLEPQGLALTYWFDAEAADEPYPVSVRFTGARVGGSGATGDAFQVVHTLERVVPGSGRIALTARISGISAGQWKVTATPLRGDGPRASTALKSQSFLRLPTATTTGNTSYLPVARVLAPGVRVGAWPSLVGLGAVVALVLQALLASQRQVPVGRLLLVSLLACLTGLVGAKVYYVLTHRAEPGGLLRAGMSVQGFVLAALTTLGVGSWWANFSVGAVLDVTAPGLLFGMMIGRLGCLLGGCCAGLPTASRWGVWSSDRRVGVRRIPVQLMESAMAGTVAIAALVAVVSLDPPVDGLLLVAGLSTYIAGRQVLFPLRGIPRATSWGRVATLVLALLVLVTAVGVLMSAAGS